MSTLITPEQLEGRTARCVYCDKTVPSEPGLFGFEYLGPGNFRRCDRCHYAPAAHDAAVRIRKHISPALRLDDHEFTDSEGSPLDRYYCGCRGWD